MRVVATLIVAMLLGPSCSKKQENLDEPTTANCVTDRTERNRPDDSMAYQVKVFYALPSDGFDEQLDTNGALEHSADAWSGWLTLQTGSTTLTVDRCGGKVDVTFMRLDRTDAELAALGSDLNQALSDALAARGFDHSRKIYAVYYGGSTTVACGNAFASPTRSPHVAALFLGGHLKGGVATCAPDYRIGLTPQNPGQTDFGMLHEIFHVLVAVPDCAPHAEKFHVNDIPADVMYAGAFKWEPSALDPGHDDYWGHGRHDCRDIARSIFLSPVPPNAEMPASW